eukprot:Pgem_evm1s1590
MQFTINNIFALVLAVSATNLSLTSALTSTLKINPNAHHELLQLLKPNNNYFNTTTQTQTRTQTRRSTDHIINNINNINNNIDENNNKFKHTSLFSTLEYGRESRMTFVDFVKEQNYPIEVHNVTTKDGFILKMGRIPYNKSIANGNPKKGTFFLQHALLCSATDWVISKNNSLPYLLAQNGYEVFLGNARGNTYSDVHTNYNKTDPRFWDWSFDDMAKYDLPAMVNRALELSGDKQTYYVGHSQGTLMAFIGFNNREVGSKIKQFFALAPIAQLNGMNGLFRYLTYLPLYAFQNVLGYFGKGQFLPSTELVKKLGNVFCGSLTPWICKQVIFLICGWNTDNFDKERLPIQLAHTPAGTSVKNVLHFALNHKNQRFGQYDYGSAALNKKKYGTSEPPLYDFDRYEVPTTLIYGTNDLLASKSDISWLKGQLGSNLKNDIEIAKYQHLDFVWGKTVYEDVYKQIVEIANQ